MTHRSVPPSIEEKASLSNWAVLNQRQKSRVVYILMSIKTQDERIFTFLLRTEAGSDAVILLSGGQPPLLWIL